MDKRPVMLEDAYSIVESKVGKNKARDMAGYAKHIFNGAVVEPPMPKKGLFR